MELQKEVPIQRIVGVWGTVEPIEGSLYLKLEQNPGKEDPENIAAIILVDHNGDKIEMGNLLFFNFDPRLNGMMYVSAALGVNGRAYLWRNNKTNGIYILERA